MGKTWSWWRNETPEQLSPLARAGAGALGTALTGLGAYSVVWVGHDGAGSVGLTGAGLLGLVLSATGRKPTSIGLNDGVKWQQVAQEKQKDIDRLAPQVPPEVLAEQVANAAPDSGLTNAYGQLMALRAATANALDTLGDGYTVRRGKPTDFVVTSPTGSEVFVEVELVRDASPNWGIAGLGQRIRDEAHTSGLMRLLLVTPHDAFILWAYESGFEHASAVPGGNLAERVRNGVTRLFAERPPGEGG